MMSMAMVYPSQPQIMVGESTVVATARGSLNRGNRSSRLTSSSSSSNSGNDKAFPPGEPVVKRTATVQEVFHNEPMQGFLIIEDDSEDDDYDTGSDDESNEDNSSSIKDCMHSAFPDSPVGRRRKPLPQIPMYIPELPYESSMCYQDELSSPITPTKVTGETPFLMIPTLEPILESLDSSIEEESSCKHEEDEPDADEEEDLDVITGEDDSQVKDRRPVAVIVPYDEKTTVEDIEEEEEAEDTCHKDSRATNNVNLPPAPITTTMANNDETASVASSTRFQKPFEPTTPSSVIHMQIPHTPEATKPPTIWSVDNVGIDNDSDIHNVLRRRASKEEVQQQPHKFPSSISICSRCSSISSASTSALSNNDLLRAATVAAAAAAAITPTTAHALPRASSTASFHTHSSGVTAGWDHHQQPLVPRPAMPASVVSNASSLHKSKSTPHLSPMHSAAAAAPETSIDLLLEPTPVKSRLSIASFSLTHDKDAIKTYRRMARKINNPDFQMTYTKYLLDVARLYNESKTYHATRERLLSEASYWIEKLAKKGVPEALFIKAKWHLQPELEDCAESYRHKPRPSKAFKCFHAAANMGWVEAHYELARLQKSRGETAQAVAGFKRAAANGHTLANYKMAKILLRGQLRQTRDIKLGLHYLHKAADAHDSDSAEPAYVLSCVYADELERIGISRDSTMSRKNPTLALQYLLKATQAGLPMAVHRMGQIHEHGLLNQPRDPWLGYSFYLRAAEDGHEGAMLDLSRLYAQGIPGYLMHQHAVAFKWCQRAAAKGLPEAEYVLGTYYEDGVGTRPDYPLALKCYSKAASKGYAPAAENLNLTTAASLAEVASAATAGVPPPPATSDSSQSSANRLSSLRIKKQPAAERPIDDEPAMGLANGAEKAPACHIM